MIDFSRLANNSSGLLRFMTPVFLFLLVGVPGFSKEGSTQILAQKVCVEGANLDFQQFRFRIYPVKEKCLSEEKEMDMRIENRTILLLPASTSRAETAPAPTPATSIRSIDNKR